jgi:hypothetical protein
MTRQGDERTAPTAGRCPGHTILRELRTMSV